MSMSGWTTNLYVDNDDTYLTICFAFIFHLRSNYVLRFVVYG